MRWHLSPLAIAGLVAALGCGDSATAPRTPLLTRYVAIGNSITAGFQAAGIDDATQRAAYPALVARQAGVRYAYASLGAGCPAPISTLASALTGSATRICTVSGRPGNRLLNNVAVPGADSFDPIDPTPDGDDLTRLILDGKNQVDKALENLPTFVTVWIGNNDVLGAAIEGVTSGLAITPTGTFIANYDAMIDRLVDAGVNAGVLVGVADVTQIPLLIPASALDNSTVRTALSLAAGETVSIDPSCDGSSAFISLAVLAAIATDQHDPLIACSPTQPGGAGDRYVLDTQERQTIQTTIAAYNAHIEETATAAGLAYYDPNPLFSAARAAGEIPMIPDVLSATPFGPLFSLDGVHPSSAAHIRIANELIGAINDRYDTGIPRA